MLDKDAIFPGESGVQMMQLFKKKKCMTTYDVFVEQDESNI